MVLCPCQASTVAFLIVVFLLPFVVVSEIHLAYSRCRQLLEIRNLFHFSSAVQTIRIYTIYYRNICSSVACSPE